MVLEPSDNGPTSGYNLRACQVLDVGATSKSQVFSTILILAMIKKFRNFLFWPAVSNVDELVAKYRPSLEEQALLNIFRLVYS